MISISLYALFVDSTIVVVVVVVVVVVIVEAMQCELRENPGRYDNLDYDNDNDAQ